MRKILFLLAFLVSVISFCQEGPQPNYIQYTTDDGLPSSEVYCSFEDSKGFMWFGTDNGVSKFDGYSFQNFGPKEGLVQNVVFNIHEDSKGRIWFGSMTGEAFYMENDSIKAASFNQEILKLKNKFSHAHLFYIDENDDKYIHLHSFSTFKIQNSKLLKYDNIQGVEIFYINETSFLCKNFEHLKLNSKVNQDFIALENINNSKQYLNEFKTVANSTEYIKDSINHIILITDSNCFKYSLDGELLARKSFLSNGTNDIIQLRNGVILIGLKGHKGILLYKNSSELFSDKNPSNYFKGLSINNLYLDKEQDLWLGSNDEGILYIPKFEDELIKQLKDKHITTIKIVENGTKIITGNSIGTLSGIYRETANEFLNIEQNNKYEISDFIFDKSSNIIYTENGYIEEDIYIPYYAKSSYFDGKGLVLYDSNLLVIQPNGLFSIDLKTNELYNSSITRSAIRQRPFSIHATYSNKVLIGYSDGLFEYKNEKLYRFIDEPELNIRIEDIEELSDSTLVLGTKGNGVILWKDSITYKFNTSMGLAADMIEDVHISDGDTIWVSTLNGLSRIVKEDKNPVRTFTKSNGLPTNEIYQVDTYNGIAYLATAKGLIKFSDPKLDSFSLTPTITELKYKNLKYKVGEDIHIPYEKNEFEINYVTLNFEQLGDIDYRFKIVEESDWTLTKNISAFFTNLSPGKYNFQVQSKNPDGYWSNSAQLPIVVDYPWYQTWFAYFLYFIFIASLIYFVIVIQAKQREQVNMLKARMLEIEKQALTAQMNPHFIFNCLNSIQNFILKDKNKYAIFFLTKFAQLTRDILEISVEGQNTLAKEIELLTNYLTLEKLRFKDKFNFSIRSNFKDVDTNIEVPSMIIQPFVENSVLHGMKSKIKDGLISLQIFKQGDKIVFIIKDNGPGFGDLLDKVKEQKKKERDLDDLLIKKIILEVSNERKITAGKKIHELENEEEEEEEVERKSYGMNITTKRLNLLDPGFLNEQIKVEELKMKDKIVGTQVTVNLPILKKRK